MDYSKKAGKQQTQHVVWPNMTCAVNPLGQDCRPNWSRVQHFKNTMDKRVGLKTGYLRISWLVIISFIFTFQIAVFLGTLGDISPYFHRNLASRITDLQRRGSPDSAGTLYAWARMVNENCIHLHSTCRRPRVSCASGIVCSCWHWFSSHQPVPKLNKTCVDKNASDFHQKHMAIAELFTSTWARLHDICESNHAWMVAWHSSLTGRTTQ